MDWALWDPSDDQVACESSYRIGHGWQRDFYFGYGLDAIEENALNEKMCIQVLRILITKADTEIVELEEDIVILQSQLAWVDEEWSEICSAALRDRIDCLDISIRSLKKENVQDEHDFGVCSPRHREPAERMHEIVKALLRNYFQPKDEQRANTIVKGSSMDSSRPAAALFNGKKILSNIDSKRTRKVKAKKHGSTPAHNGVTQKPSFKPQVKRRNYLETPPDAVVQNSSSSAEKHAIDQLKEDRKLSNSDSKISGEEVTKKTSTPAPISNLSLKPEKKTTGVEEKHEPDDTNIQDSSSDSLGHATGTSSEKKDLSKSDSRINGKQGVSRRNSIPNNNNKIPNSSLKKAGKEMNLPQSIKPLNSMVKDSRLHTLRHAAGPNGRKKLSKIDSEVISKEDVKEYSSIDRSTISESSSEPGGKGTESAETVKPADTIPDSRSGALKQAIEGSDANPKLSKARAASPDKVDTSKSSLKKEKKAIKTRREKVQEASLTDTEHTAADSLMELLNHRTEDTTKPQPKKKQRPQLKQVWKAELNAIDDESNSKLPPKPLRQSLKRKRQSNPVCVQEPCLSMELGLKSSSVSKSKRQRNFGLGDKNASFNQSANKMEEEETQSDLCGAEEPGVAPDVSINSVSQSRKKRKRSSNSTVLEETNELRGLQISVAKLHDDQTDRPAEEDLWITDSSSSNYSDIETVKLLPCPTLPFSTPSVMDVECLTVVKLKAIAKQLNLRGYSRLRRAELAARLGLMQVKGEKKDRRKEPAPLRIKRGEL